MNVGTAYFVSQTVDHQTELFFENPNFLGLRSQIEPNILGAFWVFSAKLSAPVLVQWVPCPFFPLFNHYIYKKLNLYIHIPNIYLGLGFEFEFGPQRIRDLAFVCPWSVVSDKHLYSLTLNLHILLPVYFAMHGEIAYKKSTVLGPKTFVIFR